MNHPVLVTELKATVEDLAVEALRGDEPARRWCIEAFPGHIDFF